MCSGAAHAMSPAGDCPAHPRSAKVSCANLYAFFDRAGVSFRALLLDGVLNLDLLFHMRLKFYKITVEFAYHWFDVEIRFSSPAPLGSSV